MQGSTATKRLLTLSHHLSSQRLSLQQEVAVGEPLHLLFLFGADIQKSPGPRMFNALFKELGMPYLYDFLQTESISEVLQVLQSQQCLGGSVTLPFKEAIMPLLDALEPDAKAIGSVNTVVRRGGKLVGSNTDWLGIMSIIQQTPKTERKRKALILGAGGTCKAALYALHNLGITNITVYNRSKLRLRRLAWPQKTMDLNSVGPVDIVISTVPGSAEITYPHLTKDTIVLDVAYSPPCTTLLKQAKAAGCICYSGLDLYALQFFHQVKVLTGIRVEVSAVRKLLDQTS